MLSGLFLSICAASYFVCLAGTAYVMGGRTGVGQELCGVEWFDSSCGSDACEGQWHQGPDMLEPRCALGAGALGGCLYAVGGQASRIVHNSVEYLDVERGQWFPLSARLTTMRKYVAVGGRNDCGRIHDLLQLLVCCVDGLRSLVC